MSLVLLSRAALLLLGLIIGGGVRCCGADESPPSGGTAAATIDFTRAAYPPLVKKWGGVEHWDSVDENVTAAMAANANRRTPMVLGVMQLGTTMTSDPSVIFHRSTAGGPVTPILSPARQQLRAARGGPGGVLPLLQFDGCPTPTFTVNSSSIPSPHARYYPMCSYAQLDELAAAFASWALLAQRTDGLPTAFSFWPEPGHTLSDKDNTTISENFEGYLDFYVRVAPAVKSATQDNVVAGWQLNAANGNDADPRSTMFWNATQSFLARETAATGRQRYPIDYFTIQNYQGERSALLLTNSRAALCLAPIAAASGAAAATRRLLRRGKKGQQQ